MSGAERGIYDAVENYIAGAYSRVSGKERTAVGFVITVYRRRLASSFTALRETLRKRHDAIDAAGRPELFGLDEDLPDDEAADETADAEEAARLERSALAHEQKAEIDGLLGTIGRLPPDSKLDSLKDVLRELRRSGWRSSRTANGNCSAFAGAAARPRGPMACGTPLAGTMPNGGSGTGKADMLLCTDAMAPGIEIQRMRHREYGVLAPGMSVLLRATTDAEYFEEHAESVELWSPGNPLFIAPEFIDGVELDPSQGTLKDAPDGS